MFNWLARSKLIIFIIVSGVVSVSHPSYAENGCIDPEVKLRDDSDKRAVHFAPVSHFSSKQKALLESFLKKPLSQEVWESFAEAHNDQAATFLALTIALQKTDLLVGKTETINALEMVDRLTDIHGVRFMAVINLGSFGRWLKEGGRYSIHLLGGEVESGKISFADHWQKGGGLHCGFSVQGYSHYDRPPYIHWNVNQNSGNSDIHLDGRAPWFLGFVPNPTHLQYTNSDVRYWLKSFEKKFGNPGFIVESR